MIGDLTLSLSPRGMSLRTHPGVLTGGVSLLAFSRERRHPSGARGVLALPPAPQPGLGAGRPDRDRSATPACVNPLGSTS